MGLKTQTGGTAKAIRSGFNEVRTIHITGKIDHMIISKIETNVKKRLRVSTPITPLSQPAHSTCNFCR
ncbi:hypothetical protein hamaS1_25370 [Moorella sp. Hama-1]|nr:hypothetical protein hamaS1_25370 [Moorella sp. Hama-1]